MATRKLTDKDVTFEIYCEPEHERIEGNACAIDPTTDAETNQWIHDQLKRGNEWAWCCVKVVARYATLKGVDYLGCCSYLSESDFKRDGYYDDMKAQALDDLQRQVDELAQIVCDC